jgi:hypothetical protein
MLPQISTSLVPERGWGHVDALILRQKVESRVLRFHRVCFDLLSIVPLAIDKALSTAAA